VTWRRRCWGVTSGCLAKTYTEAQPYLEKIIFIFCLGSPLPAATASWRSFLRVGGGWGGFAASACLGSDIESFGLNLFSVKCVVEGSGRKWKTDEGQYVKCQLGRLARSVRWGGKLWKPFHSSDIQPAVITRCQAKFLTSRHARVHRVIFYTSNTLRKLMIRAQGLVFR